MRHMQRMVGFTTTQILDHDHQTNCKGSIPLIINDGIE